MSIFGEEGQAEVLSLSDEALFAAEERQDEEPTPQDAPSQEVVEATAGPAEDGQPEAAPEGQADPRDTRIAELEQQIAAANRQYAEIRKLDTRVAMENGELRRQLARLQTEQQAKPAHIPPAALTPEAQRAFAERFLANPSGTLQELLGKQIQTQAEAAARSMVEPLQKQERSRQINAAVRDAGKELEQLYPQAADPKERIKLFGLLGQLAEQAGMRRDGWTNNPGVFLQQAALRLYGLPKQIDQDAINQAVEKGKANALAELQAKESGKSGLAAASTVVPAKATEEEDILSGIRAAAGGSGLFR